jgi:hypothetical protein
VVGPHDHAQRAFGEAVTASLLFAVWGSTPCAVTVAVLRAVPEALGITTIVIVTVSLDRIEPSEQLSGNALVQLPAVLFEVTSLPGRLSVSVTCTPVAVDGPLLVTTNL